MFHEGKACDAVLQFLERRESATRQDIRRPDKEGDPDPVELSMRLLGCLYAVEHTGIEPFAKQIEYGHASGLFFSAVVEEIKKAVPAGECYSVNVPVDAPRRVKSNDVRQVQKVLVAWVRETAPGLRLLEANRTDLSFQKVHVAQVPFPVSLTRHRSPSLEWPSVNLSYVSDSDEEARGSRIKAGFDKKLPKLMAWKRKHGARTVLVLENNDIQLTNHIVVTEAVLSIVPAVPDRPDEIYLVSTCDEPWQVVPMLVDEVSAFDIGGDWHWQVSSSLLENLTGR